MKNKKMFFTKLFSIGAGLFLLSSFSVPLTKVSNIGPVYASGDTKHLGKVTNTNDIKENTNYYCVYIKNTTAYVFNGDERTNNNFVSVTVDSNNQIPLTSRMAAIQFEKKSGSVYYVKIASGENNVGKYIYTSSDNKVELKFDDGKWTYCESYFSMTLDNYICIHSEHSGNYLKCRNDTNCFAFAPQSNASYRDIYLYKEFEETGPAVGDTFTDNGINYEITAVGDVNTVKVGDNTSYAGDTVNIPAKVTYKDVEFSVTEIGDYAFHGNRNLKNVTLSEWLISIEDYAFDSTSLNSITIPSTVNSIDFNAFANNDSLTTIICKGTTPPTLLYSFENCDDLTTIKVLASSLQTYKEAAGWSAYAEKIVEYYTIGSILPDNFPALSEVSIPENTWKNENNYFCGRWKNDSWDKLFFCESPSIHTNIDCSSETVVCEGGYKYSDSNRTVVFLINNDVLTGIRFDSTGSYYTDYEGIYAPSTFAVTVNAINGTIAPAYSEYVAKDTAYTVDGNKLTIDETEITATPNEGYEFDCWKIGNDKVTENGTITSDTTFTATFKTATFYTDVDGNIVSEDSEDKVLVFSVLEDDTSSVCVKAYKDQQGEIDLPEGVDSIVIPSSITVGTKTYNVTKISDRAFYGENIKSVYVPSSIVEIGDRGLYLMGEGTSVYFNWTSSGDIYLGPEGMLQASTIYVPTGMTETYNNRESWGGYNYKEFVSVQKPTENPARFVYNGEAQTYALATSKYYTISNNIQTEPGTYEVTVSLVDKVGSKWADGTDKDLKFVFVIQDCLFDVTVNASTNGSLSTEYSEPTRLKTAYTIDGNKLTIGETEIVANANEGYEFDCWKIGETKVNEDGVITSETTFTATFALISTPAYSVSAKAGENGSLSAEFSKDVEEGTTYKLVGNKLTIGETEIVANANEGYEFDCWKIGETKVTAGGTIGADTTFTATFKATENPGPQPGNKGLSGGAIAGISVGTVAGVALISYAAMFVVYAKSGKGLKFLLKSFDWLKKLFKMK